MFEKTIQFATRQKKILDTIYIERQHTAAVINNSIDIIWSMDVNYKIISANDAFWNRVCAITGKKVREVRRNDFDRHLFRTWSSYFERAYKGVAHKVIWNETYLGIDTHEEVSFNPIYDKHKKVIGICCHSKDITEQHIYLKKIERQNRLFKQIAWEHCHKVRKPVANILGLTELLNFDNPTDVRNKALLNYIRESAHLLDEVIRKIIIYTDTTTN